MNVLDAVQAVAGGLYLVVITVVGVRLLLLARRTRELPELLLGGSFILGGTIGSVVEAGGMSASNLAEPAIAGSMLLVGKLFGVLGFTCQALFIRRVFRPSEGWAVALVLALLAVMGIALAGFARHGTFDGSGMPHGFFFLELAARVAFPLWLCIESARYASLMARRLRLGLADPVVANRFVLWSWMGGLSIVLLLTSVPPLLLDRVSHATWLVGDTFVLGVVGVTLSATNWLAFFPPAAYRRRLLAHAARASATT
jgi:hypothetical protein